MNHLICHAFQSGLANRTRSEGKRERSGIYSPGSLPVWLQVTDTVLLLKATASTFSGPFRSRSGIDALLLLTLWTSIILFVSLNLSHTLVSSYFMNCSLIIPFGCFICFIPMY